MSKLNATRLHEILIDCFFRDGEDTADACLGAGVRLSAGFHPKRLESYRGEIAAMLEELPDQFHEDKGGGWSILNACVTKDGDQWGDHPNIDELLCLTRALGLVQILLPRDMWKILPGGMPYFVVLKPTPKT